MKKTFFSLLFLALLIADAVAANYAVLDPQGVIVSRIVLDRLGDWPPPAGHSLLLEPQSGYLVGGKVVDGVYTPPTPAEPAPRPIAAAEVARQDAIKIDADRAAMVARLKSATPSQIDTWVTANVTTLAEARKTIGIILKLIALDAR